MRFFTITACLLRLHEGQSAPDIAQGLHIGRRTVYHWLDLFIRRRFAWLCGHHYAGRGRKATLNAEQKQRLYELIAKGPLEADFTCGVWTSSMIAVLIERKFGMTYHPRRPCIIVAILPPLRGRREPCDLHQESVITRMLRHFKLASIPPPIAPARLRQESLRSTKPTPAWARRQGTRHRGVFCSFAL